MLNIVLYQPQIPPNTGNVARLCVGSGSKLHIIRPMGFFLDDKTMRRAGCDYWPHLDLKIHNSIEKLIENSNGANIYYVTKFGKKKYSDVAYRDGDYLLFGSEDKGLPQEMISKNKEKSVFIPMSDNVRSINLSNSVAIVMYEALRQLSFDHA